ncbi:MAG TPA: hypothetical protein VKH34_04145 [Vicinamibacterales bacterium]|nr:hypothetical protein [Vicinamibacterales bacterium]
MNDPVGILIVGGVTAAALAIALFFFGAFDTGDEAPIRVRNGSLDMYVASNNQKWKQRGAGVKEWRISGGGKRANDLLSIAIAVNAGASCSNQAGTGDLLTIGYSVNGVVITVHADPAEAKHTMVESNTDLAVSIPKDSKGRVLTYETAGYISSITLTKSGTAVTSCTFTRADQLGELLIMDY